VSGHSIGFRLTAWYFSVLAAGLAVFSVVAWFAMRTSLYHAVDDELRDRVRGVASFMNQQTASLSILEIRDEFREHSVLGPGGDLFQVCDDQGQWLYRSVPLENNNVAIQLPSQLSKPRFETTEVERHLLRFYSQTIMSAGKTYTVQVAALMDEGLEALERFRGMLLWAASLLLIAASAGGYWLATRALAPVDEISQAAQRISIESLTERLHVPQTGDQLQRLTETLNAMFSRLEASVQRMKQFTADASHELRAPVSLIRTTAEVAVQRSRPAEEYFQALNEILQEAERTTQVIDSLMLLARADSGTAGLERSLTDARAVAGEAIEQGEKLALQKGVGFAATLPDRPVVIRADGDALRRALLILIDNAVKYTPAGGFIKVELEGKDGFAVASVRDTGIGIAPQDVAMIFDRFWRADKVRSREPGGAGLGLSIAEWIVAMHEGSIEVESELGKGSVFRVRVPVDRDSQQM
jgi:two-component system heavy metal sensor histidine kinase CusS